MAYTGLSVWVNGMVQQLYREGRGRGRGKVTKGMPFEHTSEM